MIRLASWIVGSLLIAALAAWLISLPGTLTLEVANYRMQPRLGAAIFIFLLIAAAVVLIWTIVRRILTAPRALARRNKQRRHLQGPGKEADPPPRRRTPWRGGRAEDRTAGGVHDTVLAAHPTLYFDNVQALSAREPPGRGRVITLRDVYVEGGEVRADQVVIAPPRGPLAIVSPQPQTTRESLLGVVNTGDAQLAFVDTPGLHRPYNELGRRMNQEATDSLRAADVALFVTDIYQIGKARSARPAADEDGSKAEPPPKAKSSAPKALRAGTERSDAELLALIPPELPTVLVVNKIDLV